MIFQRVTRTVLLLSALLLSACNEQSAPQPSEPSANDISAQQEALKLDYNGNPPGHRLYKDPSWPLEIRKEIYGDPEIFSTPRVQFVAKFSGDKKFKRSELRSLWSMRMDGSDVRLVADEELLNYKGGGIAHDPIRSPNNRYVALSLADADHNFFRAIIDLKEQKKWIISEGGGPPHFNWTSDSENLIFYTNGYHYNYNIPAKTLSERPMIYSRGLILLPGDKQFLAFKGDGYFIHNFDGTLVREVRFDFAESGGSQYPMVSLDGQYFHFGVGSMSYIVDLSTNKIVKKFHRDRYKIGGLLPFFAPENNRLYLGGAYRYSVFNFETLILERYREHLKEIRIWSIDGREALTLFNRKANNLL